MASDDNRRQDSLEEIFNTNRDISTDPATLVLGQAGRDATGTWRYIKVSSSGAISNDDASNFRVSALGVTVTTSPLSADSSSISAKQGDAGLLRISALVDSGSVSAKSSDAATFRVSAIGGTTGDNTLVDGTTQTISATLTPISANPATTVAGLVSHSNQPDAARLRISAIVDNGSISAKSSGADTFLVSAKQGDAGVFRVSAIIDNGSVSAKSGDAANLRTSAIVDNGSVSAKSDDANQVHVSAVQGNAALLHVSGFTATAANFPVSSTQGDAGLLRVSAFLGVDTTGALTIGRLSNLSSSGNIKSSGGVVYGYYAYNTDSKPNYINFTNTSGAINVGTDSVIMKLMLAASAAAHIEYPRGLKGFTAGIGAYAVSAIADNATTPSPTSAVGINVFYN